LRRLSTIAGVAVLVALGGLGLIAPGVASAAPVAARSSGAVEVVKISGLLDPILADFLATSIEQAERDDALAMVLRIDSSESVISDSALVELATTIHDAAVPVVAWVGPSGSRAEGGAAQLLATVDAVGIAPGSSIGNMGPTVVPRRLWSDAYWQHRAALVDETMGPTAAAARGLAVAPKKALVLRNMLLTIDGFHIAATGSTAATPIQFSELSTTRTAMHTFASPAVAVLFLAIGLSLLLFEFYTAGVGVAGVVGAASLIFACYGLGVLPVRPLAVGLVIASMVAFAVDVQVGVPRLWTVVGSVLCAAGFLWLFDGVATPWPATIGAIVAVVVFMYFGMPAMTRSRFSTPMIDRKWLVGRAGTVVDACRPDGVIRIDGALWAGRGDDEVAVGSPVRVTGVDGVVCKVEPA
jgi:membrane-bound serine protease (ClpP class)